MQGSPTGGGGERAFPAMRTMPDLDPTLNEPSPSPARQFGGPDLWRTVSLLAIVAAVCVTAAAVVMARGASDVQVPDRPSVALGSTTVTLGDIATDVTDIAVLGLAHESSHRSFDPAGTTTAIPSGMAAVIAAYDAQASLVGLAIARSPAAAIEVTAESTARALLVLSPGVLRPNLDETFANLELIEADEAFQELVTAVRSNSNLSKSNLPVEMAYAAIADRIPVKRPLADQGCDSVLQRDAFAAAGACVQPKITGMLITNQQDRWALLYSGGDDWSKLCATVSPANTTGDAALIEADQCDALTLIVAPGPLRNPTGDEVIVKERLRTAAAINVLYSYAGPFADLAGGSAGFVSESTTHIRRKASELEGSLNLLTNSNDEFASAVDVTVGESTARERHLAMVSAARYLVDLSDSTALIPHRTPGDQQHVPLLDFFERAADHMVASRTASQWIANAADQIDFGSSS